MSLRNRINQFFNKSKSSPESPEPADHITPEQPTDPNAVTWDTLAAERQDDAKPQITYDDLARLVRFPGSAPAKPEDSTSVSPEVSASANTAADLDSPANLESASLETPGASVADALEIANGGGSLSDKLKPDEPESDELSPDSSTPDGLNDAASDTKESQEALDSPELRAFKNFFKTDMRIKRELLDAAPKPTDDYDEASRMDYVEDAYHTFRDFKHDFLGIARDFGFGKYVEQSTEDFFRRGQENFALGDYGSGVTSDLYRKAFTDMRPQFIEDVKATFVGYTFDGGLSARIDDASTINELLHAYHSYIMNSNGILKRVPALAEKKNNFGYPITLRGDRSALGQQVFDSLPDDLDVGWTDIVSADDHIMMMVRDRGHALTISSEPDTEDPSKIWVSYNIPKICNEEMIKALPGLAGYSPNGARGGFVVSRDQLGSSLANFIGKVPMDSDIPPRIYD